MKVETRYKYVLEQLRDLTVNPCSMKISGFFKSQHVDPKIAVGLKAMGVLEKKGSTYRWVGGVVTDEMVNRLRYQMSDGVYVPTCRKYDKTMMAEPLAEPSDEGTLFSLPDTSPKPKINPVAAIEVKKDELTLEEEINKKDPEIVATIKALTEAWRLFGEVADRLSKKI